MKLWYTKKRPKLFCLNSWEKRNWGDEEEETGRQETTQTMAPKDYTESTAARGNWWDTLQNWGKSGTYGVDTGIYNDIYSQAAKKINQYYWGSPTGPGAVDKIKSNVAQRGAQDSPATGVLSSRMAAEEANKLGDLSTTVGTAKANTIENARGNWLNSLMQLAGLKSGAYTSTGNTTTYAPSTDAWDVLGTVGSGVGMGLGYGLGETTGSDLMSTLTSLMSPQKTQSSLSDRGISSAFTDFGSNWMN